MTKERNINLTIKELAVRIDKFTFDYDPYEYEDQVENRQESVADLAFDIRRKNVEYLIEWLESLLKSKDEFDRAEAKFLVKSLKERVAA